MQGAKAIAEMLKKNSSLRVLELNNNMIEYSVCIFPAYSNTVVALKYPNFILICFLEFEVGIYKSGWSSS
jgi:hypothetical protein